MSLSVRREAESAAGRSSRGIEVVSGVVLVVLEGGGSSSDEKSWVAPAQIAVASRLAAIPMANWFPVMRRHQC
jgi:hypothetical protein